MISNTVKIEQYILDYLEKIYAVSATNKNNTIYDILKNCSYYSKNDVLDKRQATLYFSDEQLEILKNKQKELGYEDNFSRFVRYALFDFFMNEHDIKIDNEFFGELIAVNEFKQLCEEYKNELIHGKYTSYDLDLLRNNEKYKISIYAFNERINEVPFNTDFIEYDMLSFLNDEFEKKKTYSELVGLSTERYTCNVFLETEDGEKLESFIDYDNIVPNIDTFYYLFLYYAFVINPDDFDIDEIFDETDEHIEFLLEKYTFEKILKYNKQQFNIEDINIIFDEECLEYLKLNELINLDETVKSNKSIESDEITE